MGAHTFCFGSWPRASNSASLFGNTFRRTVQLFFWVDDGLDTHLYEVPALPAFGFRASAQTWGETVLVTPELLRHPKFTATMAHEKCHVAQYRRYTSFGFWLLYGWEWLLGLVRTRDLFLAYYDISLEKEARAAQSPN